MKTRTQHPAPEFITFAEQVARQAKKWRTGVYHSENNAYMVKLIEGAPMGMRMSATTFSGVCHCTDCHDSIEIVFNKTLLTQQGISNSFIFYSMIWGWYKKQNPELDDRRVDSMAMRHYLKFKKNRRAVKIGFLKELKIVPDILYHSFYERAKRIS